jgi:regulatory protein
VSGSFAGRRPGAARGGPPRSRDRHGTAERVGEPVDPEQPLADPESVARSIGLDLLTGSPKTRAQLAQAMRRRNVPDDAANAVLDRFGEVGLIDDAAFATAWVTSRQAGRGLAPRVLTNELRQRGVAEELITEAVSAIDSDDIDAAARDLVTRRARTTVGLPTAVRLRRLVAMLNRKGYSGEVAVRVVKQVLADEANGPGWSDQDPTMHELLDSEM